MPVLRIRSGIEQHRLAGRPNVSIMASFHTLIPEIADLRSAGPTYTDALGLDEFVMLRESEAPTIGFRGFTPSLLVSQPAGVNGLVDAVVDCGAEVLKPASASLRGYGGAVRSAAVVRGCLHRSPSPAAPSNNASAIIWWPCASKASSPTW